MTDSLSVTVTGADALLGSIGRTIARGTDLADPALKDPLLAEYASQNRENLLGEGMSVGGWMPLTARTLQEKAAAGYEGKRINERTGTLFRSLTEPGTDGFRVVATSDSLTAVHDLVYAAAQDVQRQLIPDPKPENYMRILEAHAAAVAAEEGFASL